MHYTYKDNYLCLKTHAVCEHFVCFLVLSAQVKSSTNITDIIFSSKLEDLANFTAQNSENTAQIVIPASIVSQIAAVNNITGRLACIAFMYSV